MRAVLNAPAFQQLKSARRGAQWLSGSLALDEQLQSNCSTLLMAAGLAPVMNHRHRYAVTVLRFQSVAAAVQPLTGLPGGLSERLAE